MSRWSVDEPDPYQWEGAPQGDTCPTCGNHPAECVCEPCADCGDVADRLWAVDSQEVYWTRCEPYLHLCAACWTRRDNYEPPDPDGEAFRGEDAAAFERDQMMAARRLK